MVRALRAEKLAKISAADAQRALDALPSAPWTDELRTQLTDAIAALAANRSDAAMAQVEHLVDEATYEATLAQANARAVAWATNRVGNLVTEVDDTTRDTINAMNARAVADGLTSSEFADEMEDAFNFSGARAEMIARTETAYAESQGALIGYRESGVVDGKEWAADDEACDECAELNGEVVGLDEAFSNGDDGPPAHPNCECFVAPVVDEEDALAA